MLSLQPRMESEHPDTIEKVQSKGAGLGPTVVLVLLVSLVPLVTLMLLVVLRAFIVSVVVIVEVVVAVVVVVKVVVIFKPFMEKDSPVAIP